MATRVSKTTVSKPILTPKQRAQRKWRDKQERAKKQQLSIYVPQKHLVRIKKFIKHIRDGGQPWEAFKMAFPKGTEALVKEINKSGKSGDSTIIRRESNSRE
jgi:hypothetical protein